MRVSLALLSFALACAGCGPSAPRTFPLPTADQITEMRVSQPAIPQWGYDEPVAEFVVPTEHVSRILRELEPGERVPNFARSVESGTNYEIAVVTICTNDGSVQRLRCYDWGHNPVVFTANGRNFYTGLVLDEQGRPAFGGVRLFNVIKEARAARK